MMKVKVGLLISIALMLLSLTQASVQAQEKAVGPINRYVKDERGPNDWIVEFLIPSNATNWRVEASGGQEKRVLSRSTITDNLEGRHRRIRVTTGGHARAFAGYVGVGRTIDTWANALTLYYRQFEPRGPARRPSRSVGMFQKVNASLLSSSKLERPQQVGVTCKANPYCPDCPSGGNVCRGVQQFYGGVLAAAAKKDIIRRCRQANGLDYCGGSRGCVKLRREEANRHRARYGGGCYAQCERVAGCYLDNR